jgi:hypothetical protein
VEFWLRVMNELRNVGVEDILNAARRIMRTDAETRFVRRNSGGRFPLERKDVRSL